jgi:hypothetical protein
LTEFIEKSLWRGVGLDFVTGSTQKTAQGLQHTLIIIDDENRKVLQRQSPPPNTGLRSGRPEEKAYLPPLVTRNV